MARITSREDLISAIRGQLVDHEWPRVVTMLILALSGAAAFGASFVALRFGVDEMAVRYPLATFAGYATFVLLIRVWIALHRGEAEIPEPFDVVDAGLSVSDVLPSRSSGPPDAGWFDFGLDVEELWFVFLAMACVLAGLVAIAYVVYIAPVLLAEVALDAALLSTVYRRLRREDTGWWAMSVLRRTWLPAAILMLFMGVAGWAMQQAAPEARSIGGVVGELIR